MSRKLFIGKQLNIIFHIHQLIAVTSILLPPVNLVFFWQLLYYTLWFEFFKFDYIEIWLVLRVNLFIPSDWKRLYSFVLSPLIVNFNMDNGAP